MTGAYLAFLAIFTLVLLISNVYLFKTKRYLYLFVNCMLFLPDYYGIEISSTFPLITVSRIMCVIFYIYAFINRRRNIDLKQIDLKTLPWMFYCIVGYFALRIISNLYYVSVYGQAVKTIFLIIFEQLFLLVAIFVLAPTKEEIQTLIKTIVWTATSLFSIGILESLTYFCPFDALYTVSRFVLNEKQVRLGLLRSTTTMGLPVFYGNMCILVLPLILYLYEISNQKKYLISMWLCILAIIHSGSRADAIFLFIILAVFVIYVLAEKHRRVEFCKRLVAVMFSVFVFASVLSIANPYCRYFYTGSVKSVLNEVGFNFDLDEGAPDENVGFGKNLSGSTSRIQQFTGLLYTARVNPIFGLGSGAQTRREIQYFTKGEWRRWHTYDLGIVEIFGDEGILGLTGVILMLLVLIIADPKNRYMQMMCLAYILTTLNTKNMYRFLLIYVILAVYNDHRLSK